MTNQLFSMSDAVKITSVKEHVLNYAFKTGKLPDVGQRVAGKRIFTLNELRHIANHFKVKLDKQLLQKVNQ